MGTAVEPNEPTRAWMDGWMMTVQTLPPIPSSQDNSTLMPWSELTSSQALADRPRAGRPSEDPFV